MPRKARLMSALDFLDASQTGANSFKLGLGSYPEISLREARELAAEALQKARAGADLVEEKRTALAEHRARKRQKPKPTIATALP